MRQDKTKRTEMVDHIYEEIADMLVNRQYSNETDMEYYKRKADGLLAMIEGFGMNPPNITIEELVPGSLSAVNRHYYACWEPEE